MMTPDSWSGPRPFVGRTSVRDALTREVDRAIAEGGRAVFLLGPGGCGQTALIGIFQEETFRRHRELRAEYVDCAHSGIRTWAELAEVFTRSHRLKLSARKVASDWLESVPILGKLLQAVAKTVEAIRSRRVDAGRGESVESPYDSAGAAVRTLLEYGPLEPRLVIMDSLDRGDSEDLAGASALIRRLPETRTLFLAAVRTTCGQPPTAINDLILEAERLGRAVRTDLPPLSAVEVEEAVTRVTRSPLPEEWREWLVTNSGGSPRDLWSLIGDMLETGKLRRAGRSYVFESSPPERVSAEKPESQHDWALRDEDRRLLALAACEGPVFHSVVLADVAGAAELEIEDRLAALCRIGLLEHRGNPNVGNEMTSRYAFRQPADAHAFAGALTERERSELASRSARIRQGLGL